MKTKPKETPGRDDSFFDKLFSFPVLFFLAVIVVASLFFWWHQKSLEKAVNQHSEFTTNLTEDIAIPEQVNQLSNDSPATDESLQNSDQSIERDNGGQGLASSISSPSLNAENVQEIPLPDQSDAIANGDSQPSESIKPGNKEPQEVMEIRCSENAAFIDNFFTHLDQQQYLKPYTLTPDSKTYFIKLIQKIFDNPPVVSGETDDLYTVLQNTAHFFRIMGNTNIIMLKKILGNEKGQFEKIAASFYNLLTSPSCTKDQFDLSIQPNAVYEYAGFFLNTMGGRLYLFRRDSVSRMVISYYSILLIDRANIENYNKHGVEIGTSIDLLINEMETTSNSLFMKETYLNTLYALQEQYQ